MFEFPFLYCRTPPTFIHVKDTSILVALSENKKNSNGYRKKMSSFSARWLQQRRRIGDGWHNWKEPLGSSSSETGNDNNLEYLCACRGSRSTATTRIRRGVRKQLQRGVLVRGTTCKESSTNLARKAGSKKKRRKEEHCAHSRYVKTLHI